MNFYILFIIYLVLRNLFVGSRWGLTPRLTGRLTVGQLSDFDFDSQFKGLNSSTVSALPGVE
jgi:hypothetical protein